MWLFSFRKSFWKTNKNNRKLREKTSWSFKSFKTSGKSTNTEIGWRNYLERLESSKIKNEINEMEKLEEQNTRNDLVYESSMILENF